MISGSSASISISPSWYASCEMATGLVLVRFLFGVGVAGVFCSAAWYVVVGTPCGFMGGFALTGVVAVALRVVFGLLVCCGGCSVWIAVWCFVCCVCCGCLVCSSAGVEDLLDVWCGEGVSCLDCANACLSCASASFWRTVSSVSTVSIGVLSNGICSISESSDAKSDAVGSGTGTGSTGAVDVPGLSCCVLLGSGSKTASVPTSHQMGCVLGSRASSNMFFLRSATCCCSAI